LFRTLWSHLVPQLDNASFSEAEKLAKAGCIFSFPVATVLARWKKYWPQVLVFWIAGLFLHVGVTIDHWYSPGLISDILNKPLERLSFAYSATNMGLWSVLILLALLVPPLRPFWPVRTRKEYWLAGLWLGTVLILILFLLASKTRGAWLIFGVLTPIVLWLDLFRQRRFVQSLVVLVLCCLFLGLLIKVPYVKHRIMSEETALIKIWKGKWQDVQSRSLGDRIHMYSLFLDKAAQAPVWGYGLGSSRSLLKASGIEHPHFHNSFFEVQIQLGFLGVVLYFGFWSFMLVSLAQKILTEPDSPWPVLLVTQIVAFALFALTHDPLGSHNGPFVLTVLSGFALGVRISSDDLNQQTHRNSVFQ
jgi:O-antigen ligase